MPERGPKTTRTLQWQEKKHTDRNLLLNSSHTKKVLYFSPAAAGKTHDKKVTDDHPVPHPRCSTLGKDTGCQEFEPKGVIRVSAPKNIEDKIRLF